MSLSPQVCKKNYKVHIPAMGEECEFWLVRVTDEQSITNPDKDHAYYTDDGKLFIYDGKNLVRVNCDICFTQEEREKLEDIEEGANKYVLPVANDSSLGGIKTGFTQTEKQYAVEVTEEGQAYVNVPWTDTVYTLPVADTDTLGGVKLGYSQNAKNYPVVKDSEGNIYVAVPWVEYQLQQASAETLGGIKTGYEQQGQNYPVDTDIEGNAYVTVPWSDTGYQPATDQQLGLLMLGHQYTLGDFPLVFDSESRAYTQLPFSNPNILDNADFKSGIINQREFEDTTITGWSKKPTVDRWIFSGSGNATAQISADSMRISGDSSLIQTLSQQYPSGTYTVAANIRALTGTLKISLVYSDDTSIDETVSGIGLFVHTFEATKAVKAVMFRCDGSGSSFAFDSIKLEKGSVYTGMPVWNKVEELNKCLYYFEKVGSEWKDRYAAGGDGSMVYITIPCNPKAKTPSVIVDKSQCFTVYEGGNIGVNLLESEIDRTSVSTNAAYIRFNHSRVGGNPMVAVSTTNIYLDAETY